MGDEGGRTNTAARGTTSPVVELDAGQLVVVDDQPGDRGVDDADGAGDELFALFGGEDGAVGEEHDVVGPLADQVGVGDGLGRAAEHAEGLVADLVAVAVGAVQQVATPPFAHAGDVGDVVAQPGGDQDAAGAQDGRPSCEGDVEAIGAAPVAWAQAGDARRRSPEIRWPP